MKKTLIGIFLSLYLSGCYMLNNSAERERIQLQQPDFVVQTPPAVHTVNASPGSLFNGDESAFFGDRKANKVNDLLTVQISERANASTSASKSLNDATKLGLGGGLVNTADNTKSDALAGILSSLNGLSNIKFDTSSSNSFSGSGSNTRNESFSTDITARIIKVMPNKVYYIEGSRELLINGEHQYISVSGVVRSEDISLANVVNSMYIANAKIYYATKGSVSLSNKQSWGSRMVKNIWPF